MNTMLVLPIEFVDEEKYNKAKEVATNEIQKLISGEVEKQYDDFTISGSPGFICEFHDDLMVILFRCDAHMNNENTAGFAVVHTVQTIIDECDMFNNQIQISWITIDQEKTGTRMFGGGAAVIKYKTKPTIMTTGMFLDKNLNIRPKLPEGLYLIIDNSRIFSLSVSDREVFEKAIDIYNNPSKYNPCKSWTDDEFIYGLTVRFPDGSRIPINQFV